MDDRLTHDQFAPYTGQQFSFHGHHLTLTLASVTANPQFALPGSPHVPFTLIFHGPAGDILPEGLYRTQVQDGPATDLYLMPIHTIERDRQAYQAVFN